MPASTLPPDTARSAGVNTGSGIGSCGSTPRLVVPRTGVRGDSSPQTQGEGFLRSFGTTLFLQDILAGQGLKYRTLRVNPAPENILS